MNVPSSPNRWLITGIFTTASELHLGDGGAGAVHDRGRAADKPGGESDAATVSVDHEGRAYLPGSGLKGALRGLVSDRDGAIDREWGELFGSDRPGDDDAVGGKLEFRDAFLVPEDLPRFPGYRREEALSNDDRNRPWWDDTRRTAVAVSVSLDRRTRTAKENLLYHLEYVPPGERFRLEIGGDNLTEGDVSRLLALLDRLGEGSASLGAQSSNGWGRGTVGDLEIRCLDPADLQIWKENPVAPPQPRPIDPTRRQSIERAKADITLPSEREWLDIVLELHLDSPWLIRDPRQRERSEAAKARDVGEALKPRDAVPLHEERGRPFVPAKSLRGALRSQAEKILRTVFAEDSPHHPAAHPGDEEPRGSKGKTTAAVLKEIASLDPVARLFGLGGWEAPLAVPRLNAAAAVAEHHQEFVAIDRFTGGAAEKLKFDATLAGLTTVTGTLTIDLGRLRRVDPELASLGLLALVLRDLAEGDIPIGSGSAKGQGICTATITWDGKDLFDPDAGTGGPLAAFRRLIPETPIPAV